MLIGVMAAALRIAAVRKSWCRPWINRREQLGQYHTLMRELRREDPSEFINFLRMPPEMYDFLLERLRPRITKQTTWYRQPLEPGLKLAITLRHFASGDKYPSLKFGFRVPANTISILVREVSQAIIDEFRDELMTCPTTPDGWRPIITQFNNRWNLPHCCGAIDGKHVAIKKPPNSGSYFYNYKGFCSIVLMAVVGPDYRFLYADVGSMGSASDGQIYNRSELKECLEDNSIGFPDPEILPHDDRDPVAYFLVGDDAFPLSTFMMKPFSKRELTVDERIYNYRICRGRRVAENGFGILANRFQVLLIPMQQRPSTVILIVNACILLHNLMRESYPGVQNAVLDREDEEHNIIPGDWRRERRTMADMQRIKAISQASHEAKKQRLLLKHYFNSSVGSVAWQRARALHE